MRYNLQGTHIELTSAITEYSAKRMRSLHKVLDMSDSSIYADVEVGRTTNHHNNGEMFRAEIQLYLAGGNLRAVAVRHDLYAAIDEVRDIMMRDIRRHYERRTKRARDGARHLKRQLREAYAF
ncbi:MAG: ribosome-associated translation inhibitor RaiA [bacterium]|nr:ribosome-associated translation inhibitor RaiA [bacterium]